MGSPKYVTKIDALKNTVTLGDHDALYRRVVVACDMRLRDMEWLKESPHVQARIRYKSPAVDGVVSIIDDEHLRIAFDSPVWGVTPGQSLVIYKDDLVVGGGILTTES